jgi:hypothetical protein
MQPHRALAESHKQRLRLSAAVQVAFERHILKPGFHFIGQGLKPGAFELWVNNCIQLAPPHLRKARQQRSEVLDAAVQVECEKSKVCNRFFTMGQGAVSRVGAGRFQAMGQTAFNVYSPLTWKGK